MREINADLLSVFTIVEKDSITLGYRFDNFYLWRNINKKQIYNKITK